MASMQYLIYCKIIGHKIDFGIPAREWSKNCITSFYAKMLNDVILFYFAKKNDTIKNDSLIWCTNKTAG